jgi:nitrate/nitrite transporter NarK
MFLGSRVGGMLSAPVALFIVSRWGWRTSFVLFGTIGLAWAAAWFTWYRDRPEDHPAVNTEELAWIRQDQRDTQSLPRRDRTPWGALLRSRNLYAICAMYFAFGYGLYFYFTWLPTYLIKQLGFSVLAGGLFASLPFVLAGFADLAGGWLTDYLCRTRGLRAGRCYLGCAAFLTCAALVFSSTLPVPSIAKAVLLALALASADLALGACWAVPIDIAPDHAGVITGFMNTLGNLGGLVGPLVVGIAVDRWGSWTFPFYVTATVYACGALAWLAIDPTQRLMTKER